MVLSLDRRAAGHDGRADARNQMTSLITRIAAVVFLAALVAPPAIAQQHRAALRGIVIDPAGRPLPSVELRITREATSEVRRVRSDDEGRFAAPELAPGGYRIEAEHPGFGTFRARAELEVNQDFWLDVSLPVATVVQAVDVTARFLPIETESPALTTRIDQRQILGLPLDGRNFLELALLAPGTAPAPQGSASSIRGDFAVSVNGGREDFNGFLLDGLYNIDPKLNTPSVRPPVDAIREFEVLTSSYDASFGRNASGQVNVITRSGGNQYSGAAYEFYRNGAMGARNHFAPKDEPAPDYSRHQFGGAIGGPVLPNRTFFFADYERTRLREGVTRITSVPTLAERNGDFLQSPRRPVDPFTRQPFPGGQVPSFFIHPAGRAIAQLFPEPNRSGPGGNFVSSPTLRDDIDQFDTRIDHGFSGGSRLTARYSFSDRRLFEPFAGASFAAVPGYGTDVPRRGQNLSVTYTQVRSSSFVNDLRAGYNRVAIGVFAEDSGLTNASVGLPSLSANPRDAGLSIISISGFTPLGHEFTTPQESASDTVQLADTATWMRGAHLVKFGGEWYGVRQSAYRDVQARGFLNFIDQGYTGNALADLLLGLPVLTGGARLDNPQNLRSHSWSLFAHDDWRASPTLTISAGLRYDYMSPAVDADDRANLYDAATGQLVPVGTAGVPRGGYEPDRNNIAPRAGFAWTIDKAAQTVLRGGYGIYYNQGSLATSEGLYFNPPYFNLGVFFPFPGLPPLTLSDPFPALFPIPVPQSATAFQRDLQTPWMEHYTVSVQRQIGPSRALEIAYAGSRGHDLISARDTNQAPASPAQPNLRPNPAFADITLIESRATSRYNALQMKFHQRIEHGLSLLAAYTFGKSTDDASGFFTSAGDPNFPQNSLDPAAERGRSAFDVRHRFSMSFAYALPFGEGYDTLADEGWVTALVSNWEVQGVVTLQSGRPFTVALLPEIDQSNTGRSNLGFGNNDRPNVSGETSVSSPDENQWFNTAAFSMPAFGTFGNAGRNILTGPDYRNVSLAVIKGIRFGTRAQLQLRAEAFNLFNRVNFDLPDAFFGSPTFGRILSAGSPRRIQFGVKALF